MLSEQQHDEGEGHAESSVDQACWVFEPNGLLSKKQAIANGGIGHGAMGLARPIPIGVPKK